MVMRRRDHPFSLEERQSRSASSTLVQRLQELRGHLLKMIGAILMSTVIAFFFRAQIISFLSLPFPEQANGLTLTGQPLVITGLAEGFLVMLNVSLAVGFLLALPIVLYQIWAFMVPAWLEMEKKRALPFVSLGLLLFSAGLVLGYLILRYPLTFLVTFAEGHFTVLITARSYFGVVMLFLLTFGILFEIPLVLTFLSQLGILTAASLKRKRPIAHFGLWVAATFLMPGGDIWSPVITGLAMSSLYELTFLCLRWFKQEQPREGIATYRPS